VQTIGQRAAAGRNSLSSRKTGENRQTNNSGSHDYVN